MIINNFCSSPGTFNTSTVFLASFPTFLVPTSLFGSDPHFGSMRNFQQTLSSLQFPQHSSRLECFPSVQPSQEPPHSSCYQMSFHRSSRTFSHLSTAPILPFYLISLVYPATEQLHSKILFRVMLHPDLGLLHISRATPNTQICILQLSLKSAYFSYLTLNSANALRPVILESLITNFHAKATSPCNAFQFAQVYVELSVSI